MVTGHWGGFLVMLASHQAARAASPPEAYHTNPRNSLPSLCPLLTTSNLQPLFFKFFCQPAPSFLSLSRLGTTWTLSISGRRARLQPIRKAQLSALVPWLLRLISLDVQNALIWNWDRHIHVHYISRLGMCTIGRL